MLLTMTPFAVIKKFRRVQGLTETIAHDKILSINPKFLLQGWGFCNTSPCTFGL